MTFDLGVVAVGGVVDIQNFVSAPARQCFSSARYRRALGALARGENWSQGRIKILVYLR